MAMLVVRACTPLIPTPLPAAVGEAASMNKSSTCSTRAARVLVLGGTGRVGWSTATALSKLRRPDLNILIGGRNREKGKSLASKLGKRSEFVQVDIHDASMLEEALCGVDLVVHAAGPFQREDKCTVLEAAISTKTPYVDVCDDVDYSWRAKGFHKQAEASGVPAIITAGICPGVSNCLHIPFTL
ncbi:uncharacterized protein C2845_PM05G06070 [Panicum miliaceum]|uniref:Saccharopine dehydrogenase NADP binding domain-containing protein n=1 Tax=Panicum miliaceum TaxID=4540 RepID=A0A3L6T395_PANMI|nr:uncharacterized protein C2845_PM05G06070 [Panicum miliaceum]